MTAVTLSPEFRSLGLARLSRLRQGSETPATPPPDDGEDLASWAEEEDLPSEPVEDRIVKLEEARGKRAVLRDPPASLASLNSVEDLPKYGVDGLRKLAKASGVEFPRTATKESLVKLLAEAHGALRSEQEDCR